MQLEITFRKMESSDALRDHVQEKLAKIRKYIDEPMKAHVVLGEERRHRYNASILITLHNGVKIKGVDSSEDLYQSIEKAIERIEKQVRKYKEKIKNSKPRRDVPVKKFSSTLIEVETEEEVDETPEVVEHKHRVVKTEEYVAEPLTVDEAIMHLELQHKTFLVFTNADTHEINVVYRREDGVFGLIETHHS